MTMQTLTLTVVTICVLLLAACSWSARCPNCGEFFRLRPTGRTVRPSWIDRIGGASKKVEYQCKVCDHRKWKTKGVPPLVG
jgi:primosomal protein N'